MMDESHKKKILLEGPIGLWCTSTGTADILGSDEICFNPDGTGLVTTHSVLFGKEDSAFVWRMSGLGLLNLKYVLEDREEDEPDYWFTQQIEFRLQRHDAGSEEVLGEVGSDNFWGLKGPLRWIDS